MSTTEEFATVYESARYIAQHSDDVIVVDENSDIIDKAVQEIARGVEADNYGTHSWAQHALNPKQKDQNTVNWIFVIDLLNFSFWSDETEPFTVRYKGEDYRGYWSLCAAINRALDEGYSITSPSFYANLDLKTFQHIFRSDSPNQIPLSKERFEILTTTGKILFERFKGDFGECVRQAEKSAHSLIEIVVKNFSSFNDVAEYKAKKVKIFKRAQILVADIWACFEGKDYGEFHDIDSLTMFADYRVPQALLHLEVLKYSDKLLEKLQKKELFQPGEKLEVEIRGCSIWVVEVIRKKLIKYFRQKNLEKKVEINAILIDFYLWDFAKKHSQLLKDLPIHRIRSIYY